VSDLVEHEKTGLLVDPGDKKALGEALVRLVTEVELLKDLSLRGQEFVYRNHDLEKLWPRIWEAIQRQ